jgi:hypothetical protein
MFEQITLDDVPSLLLLAAFIVLLAVLVWVAIWPLDRPAKEDPMARPFGDWPHMDPRL